MVSHRELLELSSAPAMRSSGGCGMSAASAGAFWFWFFGSVNGAVEKIIAVGCYLQASRPDVIPRLPLHAN